MRNTPLFFSSELLCFLFILQSGTYGALSLSIIFYSVALNIIRYIFTMASTGETKHRLHTDLNTSSHLFGSENES